MVLAREMGGEGDEVFKLPGEPLIYVISCGDAIANFTRKVETTNAQESDNSIFQRTQRSIPKRIRRVRRVEIELGC